MRKTLVILISTASLMTAGVALGASKHPARGYYHSSASQSYRSACAQQNAKRASEPGSQAIQDRDWSGAVGGRRGTC